MQLIEALRRRMRSGLAVGTTPERLRADEPIAYPRRDRRRRASILRAGVDRTSKVLEIGPLAAPVVPKRDGFNAFSADVGDRAWLAAHYRDHGMDTGRIEEVDFVIRDADLAASVPTDHHATFDAVIASHVLEHTADPLAFLAQCAALLAPGGVLSLALPDKRTCFDMLRPLSTTGAVLEAHRERRTTVDRHTLFETACTSVAVDGEIVRNRRGGDVRDMTFVLMDIATAYRTYLADGAVEPEPRDCHAWVFTPSSFALIAHETHALGLLDLTLDDVAHNKGTEFFAQLRKRERRPIDHYERMQFMALAAQEQAEGFAAIRPSRR